MKKNKRKKDQGVEYIQDGLFVLPDDFKKYEGRWVLYVKIGGLLKVDKTRNKEEIKEELRKKMIL